MRTRLLMARLVLCLLAAWGSAAQEPASGDRERGMWNTEFRNARAQGSAPQAVAHSLIGVTLWRLRPSRPADQARLLVHEPDNAGGQEFTPERISTTTRLLQNDRVRLTIESGRAGYLYVASHEQYADGSTGRPYLIFPSRRILGGSNKIQPGRVVDIPEPMNARPYLTLRKSRPDQVSEVLTVLVSDKLLPNLMVESGPLPLEQQELDRWRKHWGGEVKVIETPAGTGQAWTAAERDSATGGKLLRPADPAPQAIYRTTAKPDAAAIVSVQLNLAR